MFKGFERISGEQRKDWALMAISRFLKKLTPWKIARFLKYHAKLLFASLLSKNGYVTKVINGSKMLLSVHDKGISKDLILNGYREEWATAYVKNRLQRGSVVLDIGANIGYYALLESTLVGSEGIVYAVEPVVENVNILRRNIELNGYKNIEVFDTSIGSVNGTAKMYIHSEKFNLHSFYQHEEGEKGETRDVPVCTVDSFLIGKKTPNFVRMDVEGAEYYILQGIGETLAKAEQLTLFIELHVHQIGLEKTVSLLKYLKDKGFEIDDIYNSKIDINTKEISDRLFDILSELYSRSMGCHVFFEKKV